MPFYSIKTTSERKIIGPEYPQIQTMDGNIHRDAEDSVYNVFCDTFPHFEPNLDHFVLHEKALLTDIVSAAMISCGLVVNQKVKMILEDYRLPPHKFYPAVIKHKGSFHKNYFWFYFISDIFNYIDYKETKFIITDMFDNKIEDCNNINSASSLRSLKNDLPDDKNVDSELIRLDSKTSLPFDLFKITFGNYRTFITEKLKEAFTENSITGINIVPAQKLI
jgi:hypothetical protein